VTGFGAEDRVLEAVFAGDGHEDFGVDGGPALEAFHGGVWGCVEGFGEFDLGGFEVVVAVPGGVLVGVGGLVAEVEALLFPVRV
jgi:hypothetical protein